MTIVKKMYARVWKSRPGDPALSYLLTLFNERHQETCLQCSWDGKLGTELHFSHLQINAFYLDILQEAWLMRPLSDLGFEVSPDEFEALLHQLGFVHEPL